MQSCPDTDIDPINQSNDVLAYLIISPSDFPPLQPALLPEPYMSPQAGLGMLFRSEIVTHSVLVEEDD